MPAQLSSPSFDEDGKLEGPSLCEWFEEAAKTAPTLLCLDANTRPDQAEATEEGQSPQPPSLGAAVFSAHRPPALARAAGAAALALHTADKSVALYAGTTVWKTLRSDPRRDQLMGSVWDEYFDANGALIREGELPATTNKMRGPISTQPKKIGEHT